MVGRRKKGLLVLTSSNQMFSGTGTYVFDWLRLAGSTIEFSVVMDTADSRNAVLTAEFCRAEGIHFIPMAPNPSPGCPDHGVRGVARLLRSGSFDFVECLSWANAATNQEVLSALTNDQVLIFTPQTQPLWTLQDHENHYMVMPVLQRMLDRADAILLLASNELNDLNPSGNLQRRCVDMPHGVDCGVYRYSGDNRRRSLLTIGDFGEVRKRADLLLSAFAAAASADPDLNLVIAGNRSGTLLVPTELTSRISRRGYVSRDELISLYGGVACFILLSDYEAFGLPIAEALCCGTPVIIHQQEQLQAIYGGLPGVRFVENRNTAAVAEAIAQVVQHPADHQAIAGAAGHRFSFEATYGLKLRRILDLCS